MANALGAKFIIIKNENIIHEIQNLATYYLFDSKIAMIVNDKNDILRAIKLRIDAVIYRRAIKMKFLKQLLMVALMLLFIFIRILHRRRTRYDNSIFDSLCYKYF